MYWHVLDVSEKFVLQQNFADEFIEYGYIFINVLKSAALVIVEIVVYAYYGGVVMKLDES